ncbi:SpoIVB peptidase [Clostridium manihotivorum]|uniref:SpoIVB peptidase n=1 Tax=Clostridium manihotivorum TaxID=2320868 RepID=A0A3R5V7V4_9CLOT|nr:SpoIVB peptidase [Clostridium manihotivorum]QAA32077.1 SpoIVB peptidase [Clostridium manihotivorum]
MNTKLIRNIFYTISLVLFVSFYIFSSNVTTPTRSYMNIVQKGYNIFASTDSKKVSSKERQTQGKNITTAPMKSVFSSKSEDLEIYPGGSCVGVKIQTKGVLVVGFSDIETNEGKAESPSRKAGIMLGDVVLKVNSEDIENSKDLIKKLNNLTNSDVKVTISHNNEIMEKTIISIKSSSDEKYKIGLWVRDSTAGVGTLTFYDENTKKFGALGHPITDNDTNTILSIKDGSLINTSIISVRKGQKGNPGELKGVFVEEDNPLGEIKNNTVCGIFGTSDNKLNTRSNKPLKVGFRDEIKEGKAKIITTIDESGPQMYDIEIVKLLSQDKPGPKSMIIKVTDPKLLEKTGGIVQGMSGSPIIQNNKIVGAVTHVLINKPDVGYGIYIEWMLKDAGIIN